MFDTSITKVDTTPTGIIRKTHENSYITRFRVNSSYANQILKEYSNVVVLQILVMGEWCIAEIVDSKIFRRDLTAHRGNE